MPRCKKRAPSYLPVLPTTLEDSMAPFDEKSNIQRLAKIKNLILYFASFCSCYTSGQLLYELNEPCCPEAL